MSKVNRGNNRAHQRRAYGVLMILAGILALAAHLGSSARQQGNRRSVACIVTLALGPLNHWNADRQITCFVGGSSAWNSAVNG